VATVGKKRLALLLVVAAVCIIVTGYSVKYVLIWDVSMKEVVSDPQSFDGMHLRLVGYVVKTNYMFGPKYVLRDFDDAVEVALDGKGGPRDLDLELYACFVFDGISYTRLGDSKVSIVGYVRYIGWVTDFPSFYLDVEKVEPITS
jgi:hypothetical protein